MRWLQGTHERCVIGLEKRWRKWARKRGGAQHQRAMTSAGSRGGTHGGRQRLGGLEVQDTDMQSALQVEVAEKEKNKIK